MAHRQLYVEKAVKLSLSDNSVVIIRGEGKQPLQFPIEDFDLIFVEDPNVVITSNLLTKMSDLGASMVICGPDYLPNTQILPFNTHYLQTKILDLQLGLLPYKKKKLWEYIVRQKISNQISVLENTNADSIAIDRLKNYLVGVKPGDETNMEGAAARIYFASLFGDDFARFAKDPISLALNYGYGIIASQVIRAIAFSGLFDNLGVWHDSQSNNHNLSYDLIEPYRQVVDFYLYNHRGMVNLPLPHELKVGLIGLLNEKVNIGSSVYKVSHGIGLTINSYVEYLKSGDISVIKLPVFKPLPEGIETSDGDEL